MALVCSGVSARFGDGSPFVFEGVSLAVEPGRVVCVLGPSGSGKSTLLACMAGARPVAGGAIEADGLAAGALEGGPEKASIEYRRNVALVAQQPERQLFAQTAFEDVLFGPRNAGCSEDEALARVEGALAAVGLDADEARKRSPFAYSGGEQRRLALAGMLAIGARYLLLDEPTAGLDAWQTERIGAIVARLSKEGRGVCVVTHDIDFAARIADEAVLLYGGAVRASGPARDVLSDSQALRRAGLAPQAAVEIADRLRMRGIDIGPCATSGEFARAFARLVAPDVGSAGEHRVANAGRMRADGNTPGRACPPQEDGGQP